jgi:hypothetical protein
MSSVTKNPMVIQSAQNVNNWFLTKISSDEEMLYFNTYEELKSDKTVLNFIENDTAVAEKYNQQDSRLASLMAVRNGV